MMPVLPTAETFRCMTCGSTYLPKGSEEVLCTACWDEFVRWTDSIGVTDKSRNSMNRWMARRLMLDATRLARFGMTGRCEAIRLATRGWLDGFDVQCRNRATEMRDGRRVCTKHAIATHPVYAGDYAHDPYADMQRVMAELARSDERFRQALVAALDETLAHTDCHWQIKGRSVNSA